MLPEEELQVLRQENAELRAKLAEMAEMVSQMSQCIKKLEEWSSKEHLSIDLVLRHLPCKEIQIFLLASGKR